MFEGRRLVIATKHGKEEVLTPILERELGVHCFTLPTFDSDLFGTFSGEVERLDDALLTARLKCEKAMEIAQCDLAIAARVLLEAILHFTSFPLMMKLFCWWIKNRMPPFRPGN